MRCGIPYATDVPHAIVSTSHTQEQRQQPSSFNRRPSRAVCRATITSQRPCFGPSIDIFQTSRLRDTSYIPQARVNEQSLIETTRVCVCVCVFRPNERLSPGPSALHCIVLSYPRWHHSSASPHGSYTTCVTHDRRGPSNVLKLSPSREASGVGCGVGSILPLHGSLMLTGHRKFSPTGDNSSLIGLFGG